MPRLAIISTHPIQYNAPWFALLNKEEDIELKVFYTWSQRQTDFFDEKFGKEVKWDIPLLDGYEYAFMENRAKDPGNHHFNGIICPKLISEIKAWEATHLLVFGWNFKAHLQVMRHFHNRIPVLFRGDSTLLTETGGFRDLLRRLVLKWIYRSIDFALYVGNANKKYYLKHGLKESQLYYAPHAIDNNRFTIDSEGLSRVDKWRSDLEIRKSDFVFMYIGKFEIVKNISFLLKAFDTFQKQHSGQHIHTFKLVLLGSGALEQELKEQAKTIENVIFLPFQNQSKMPEVYRLGNILCLTSVSETWGLVVNEAMASGMRCILSDKVGCAEDLGVLKGNYVFPVGEIDAMVSCMQSAINENEIDTGYFLSKWNFSSIVKSVAAVIR